MKVSICRIAFALFIITTLFLTAYGVRQWRRMEKEEAMNIRELHYDADGGFAMIDIGDGHLGVYDAVKPIRHIWSKRLKRIAPGTYNLSISDGWIELYNRTMRGSYVIQMKDDDTKFFLKYVEQDIPVLVY